LCQFRRRSPPNVACSSRSCQFSYWSSPASRRCATGSPGKTPSGSEARVSSSWRSLVSPILSRVRGQERSSRLRPAPRVSSSLSLCASLLPASRRWSRGSSSRREIGDPCSWRCSRC
jgi:hypothetical protein